jgi:excisionase family DNA binding protein
MPGGEPVHPAVLQLASVLAALSAAPGDDDGLLTIDETRRKLRVSRATVTRAIAAGDIPVVRLRRSYRIPAAFVRRAIARANGGESVVIEDLGRQWAAEHRTPVPEAVA